MVYLFSKVSEGFPRFPRGLTHPWKYGVMYKTFS